MSMFGNIMSKIFGHASATAATPASAEAAPGSTPTGAPAVVPGAVAATPSAPVDVEAVLTDMASHNPQKLNWQTSIVDLMKLLGLDSSLSARQQLASELNYSGDTNDSATMNMWLSKQVMAKLAENGGKVPDSLRT